MTLLEQLIEGLRILSRHYPNANTGAEHDQFYIYSDDMYDEDGNSKLDEEVKGWLDKFGFHWNEEEHYWYTFT